MSQPHRSNAADSAATPADPNASPAPAPDRAATDAPPALRAAAPRPSTSSPSAFHEPADGYVAPSARPAPSVVGGGSCRYCGSALPEGRQVTFCPNCGQNVTVIQCPACSTELELGWKFCITCGRSADAASDGAVRAP
jgi:hypothetical protein